MTDFEFVACLSESADGSVPDSVTVEEGIVTDVVARHEAAIGKTEVYLCGPPPMVDAALDLLDNQFGAQGSDLLRQFTSPLFELGHSFNNFAANQPNRKESPMSAPEKPKERSFPKIEFTDSEAGALVSRVRRAASYSYYKPAKLRATMYEDVTVDVQPDPDRHLTQGWIYGFGDGPGGYPQDWTAAKSSNWHAFLDPNEEWDQTIFRNNAAVVRQVELCLKNAKRAHAYDGWNSLLAEVPRTQPRSVDARRKRSGTARLRLHPAVRPDEHDQHRRGGQRRAQDALRPGPRAVQSRPVRGDGFEGFDGSAHREVWQSAPEWQPTREVVEQLTAVGDWCQLLFATNIVFEQLVGSLFRSELVMQIAARNGDYITPTIVGTGEHDYDRDLAYTRNLFRLLTRDPEYGESNKALFGTGWRIWVPRCLEAAHALQPIWSTARRQTGHVRHRASTLQRQVPVPCSKAIELDIPEELDK